MKNAVIILLALVASQANAWEANVKKILQHDEWVAVELSPNPGNHGCESGTTFLLKVDDSPATQQKYSLLLSALVSGKKVYGYNNQNDCVKGIWSNTRPPIDRIGIVDK